MDGATQEEQVEAYGATQAGGAAGEGDDYDSSDNEASGTKQLLEGFANEDEDEDEDDEDYDDEKARKKSKRASKSKSRVVDDDDEDDEVGGQPPSTTNEGTEPLEGEEEEEEESSEESSSDSDADDVAPKKRRAPSARQKARATKEKAKDKKARAEAKKAGKEQQPMSTLAKAMSELKKQKKTELSSDQKKEIVLATLKTMRRAYEKDREHRHNKRPALEKLKKLDEVTEKLGEQQLAETFVANQVGHELVLWLKPGRKNLPNIKMRTKLFQAIEKLPFAEVGDAIKESNIGKILNFYRSHPEETLENKRLTNAIISRWLDVLSRERV